MIEPDKYLAIFDSPNYILNKKLLIIFGLWPTLSRTRKSISFVVILIITFSLIIPLSAGVVYYYKQNNWINIMENFCGIAFLIVTWTKYCSSYIFEDRIKLIYEQTANDWKNLKDEQEIQILNKFGNFSQLLTSLYFYYSVSCVLMFQAFPFITIIMDKIMPLENNETRIRVEPYHPHYFNIIDPTKYYYHLYITHGLLVAMTSTVSILAIDAMFAANIQHACALYAIVRYRLSKIGKLNNETEYETRVVDDKVVTESIKQVCDMHSNSMKSVDLIWNSFSISFLLLMGYTLTSITIIMFDFLFNLTHPVEKMMAFVMIVGVNIFLCYQSWIAQLLTNSTEDIYLAVCSNQWYNLSSKGQKLLYFVLQNCQKPIVLRPGGIVDLNLLQFASILKAELCYATVMISVND